MLCQKLNDSMTYLVKMKNRTRSMGKNHLREIICLVLWGSLLVNVAYGQTDEAFKARDC